MSSRVSPNGASAHGDQEMPTSAQPTMSDVSFVVNIQEQENVNEQLLDEIDKIYSPVLKLMKLFGIYFGKASLKSLAYTPGRCKKLSVLPCIYCGVVVSGFWLNVVLAFSGIFLGNNIFLFLMYSFFNLFIALNGTMSLVLLRLTGTKKSQFEKFLANVLPVIKNVNLEKVKAKSKKGLIVFCFFYMVFVVAVVASATLLNINLTDLKPWNQWFGLRILSLTFAIIGPGVWLLPILFLCITCSILEEFFNDLHKKISPFHSDSKDLAALKLEYLRLCDVVELADKMLSPLLFEMVSLYIPLLCFSLYNVVHFPEDSLFFVLGNISWLLISACILAVILLFGSKVSEKINSFQKILQTFPVSTADEVKLVMFLLDIQGDPKGLTIGGLVVITKSLCLTIVGVIISYFAVMLSLPK